MPILPEQKIARRCATRSQPSPEMVVLLRGLARHRARENSPSPTANLGGGKGKVMLSAHGHVVHVSWLGVAGDLARGAEGQARTTVFGFADGGGRNQRRVVEAHAACRWVAGASAVAGACGVTDRRSSRRHRCFARPPKHMLRRRPRRRRIRNWLQRAEIGKQRHGLACKRFRSDLGRARPTPRPLRSSLLTRARWKIGKQTCEPIVSLR